MNLILLSNNIRGVDRSLKQKRTRELCSANKVSILGLQETVVSSMSGLQIRSFWGNCNFVFCY